MPYLADKFKTFFGDTDPSGMGIINEDLGFSGVRVESSRYAANVVSVAEGKQREDTNHGVLYGV